MQTATERTKGIVSSDVRMTARRLVSGLRSKGDGKFLIAPAGTISSGKSSIINSFANEHEKKSTALYTLAKDLALLHSEVAR